MKTQEIAKTYDPKKIENNIYKKWETSGLFSPSDKQKSEAFSISMPPPNATGTLHLGHAVMLAIEDIMTRKARMEGKKTLWLPGTDHAAIATENKVEKNLIEKKGKTKQEIGREKFLKEVEKFVASSQSTIKNQIRKMGASCDWTHERYTLDKDLSRLVQEVFVKMHKDGLIYRGNRIVNWCTRCQSTLADDEVEYKEQYGKFYYLKYGPVTIGTARPETKVLDKVIVVHPKDKRYKKWIGKTLEVPWIDGTVKAIFVADEAADMKFGSGAMTITPAHSFIDFDIAQKNGFEIKQIIGPDGKLTKNGGKFAGMDVREAREAIIKELDKKGLVEKIDENYVHNLSVCYRCDTPVEPLVSEQWFVDVNKPAREWKGKKRSLKEIAIDAVKSGDIEIIPKKFNKTYFQWMENLHDWCVSRQIWFGHHIPVWYNKDDKSNYKVSIENPGKNFEPDTDTLDTWFSSSLWTFSTLLDTPQKGDDLDSWIKRNRVVGKDLAQFHPTSIMETGYDILFFWVARMILMTTYTLGEIPFKKVYLHGLVRDKSGRKMSKSIGNGIDPIDMIEMYGADATRLSLVIGTAPGNDSKLYEEKIAGYRNFVNKIWNISRFVLTSGQDKPDRYAPPTPRAWSVFEPKPTETTLADKWILSRLQNLIKEVNKNFEKYEYSQAGEKIYNFLWHEFADWYLEISKKQIKSLAPQILLDSIKLLHPFTPFITEEIFQRIKELSLIESKDEFLAQASWPEYTELLVDKKAESDFEQIQSIVWSLRNLRAEHNLAYSEKLDAAVDTKKHKDLFQEQELVIEQLTKVRIQVVPTKPADSDQYIVSHAAEFDVYLKLGQEKIKEQRERLTKEKTAVEKYINSIEKKLSNKSFIQNAPKEVIEKEKQKLLDAKEKLKKFD